MRYRAIKVGYLRRPFGHGGQTKTVEIQVGEEFELPEGYRPGRWMVPVEQPAPRKAAPAKPAAKPEPPADPASDSDEI